jgi:mRNA interferase MazF
MPEPMPGSSLPSRVWDVIKVPFPYTARPIQQRRPALVISSGRPADRPFVIWALMITSAENRRWAGDIRVSDLAAAGLPSPSVVRTDKIATIEIADAEPIGRLVAADIDGVRLKLDRLVRDIR